MVAGIMPRDYSLLEKSRPAESFDWLPASKAWHWALAVLAGFLIGITFAAYLRPNMVFDFANLIFCARSMTTA